MAEYEDLFSDPDFRSLPADRQRSVLSEMDADFAGLDQAAQDSMLSEKISSTERGTDYLGELKRGAIQSGANMKHLAANLTELVGMGDTAQRLREEQAALEEEAEPPQDRYTSEYLAYVMGGLPANLAAAALFVEAASMGLPAWAAAPVGFGALGALGAADQGPEAAAKAGAMEGAFGALFPLSQHMNRAIRGPLIGAAAYGMGEGGDQPTDQRLTDAAVMGVLGGLPGRRPIMDPLRRLGFRDRAMEKAIESGSTSSEHIVESVEQSGVELAAKELSRAEFRAEQNGPGVPEDNVYIYDFQAREPQLSRRGSDEVVTRGAASEETPAREPVEGEVLPHALDMPGEIARRGGDSGERVEARLVIGKEDVRRDVVEEYERINGPGSFPDVEADLLKNVIPGVNNPGIQDVGVSTDLGKRLYRHGAIIEKLAKALGIPVKGGKLPEVKHNQKDSFLGYVRTNHPWKGDLRIRDHHDIETTAHEMGHALDHFMGMGELMHRDPNAARFEMGDKPYRMNEMPRWLQELYSLTYDLGHKKAASEGFAELARMWFTNRKYLEERTPNALKKFEDAMQEKLTPKQYKKVREVQQEMHGFFKQGGRAGIRAGIGAYDSPASVLWSKGSDMRAAALDDFEGIRNAMKQMGIPLDGSVYETFRRLRGIGSIAEAMVKDGAPKWENDPNIAGKRSISFDGKGIFQALKPVLRKGKKALQAFWDYAVARQAKELKAQTIDPKTEEIRGSTARERALNMSREKLFSENMIESGMALENPVFKKAFDDLVNFQKRVADFAQEAGLFSAAQRQSWKRIEYAFGFFRDLQNAKNGYGRRADKLSSAVGVHRLHGSTRNLKDPYENLVKGPARMIQAALENKARVELVDTMRGADAKDQLPGRFMVEVPATHKRVMIGRAKLEEAIEREMMDTYKMSRAEARDTLQHQGFEIPEAIDHIAVFMGSSKPYGDGSNIMTVLRNGKPFHYEVADEGLRRALAAMNRPTQVGAMKFWSNARRWKQNFITIDPSFVAANFVRDVAMASIMSKTGNFHLWKALAGIKHVFTNDRHYQDFIANGGGGATIREAPETTKRRLINQAQRGSFRQLNPERLLHGPADMWRFMDRFGRAMENASRVGEYRAAVKKGVKRESFHKRVPVSKGEAAYLGREVSTDFSMRGDSTGLLNFAVHTIPFFNAMIAGGDRGYRAAFRDPYGRARVGTKMAAVALTSTILYGANKELAKAYGPEAGVDFDDLPEWVKTAYWHWYIPIEFDNDTGYPTKFQPLSMPKLWEVGAIGTLAERVYEEMTGSGDADIANLATDMLSITATNFNINVDRGFPLPLPVGADLLLEQFSNKILFTGAPIETKGMEDKPAWLRSRSTQPASIKAYGKAVRNVPFGPLEGLKSPARAEALLRGMFGEFAMMGMHIADLTMNPNGPEMHNSRLPVIKRFYREAGKYDKNTTEFYDRLAAFSEAYAGLDASRKANDQAIVKEMTGDEQTMAMLGLRKPFKRANKRIQLMRRESDAIRAGVTMKNATPKEKQVALDSIEKERRAIMKQMNEMAMRRGM